MSELVKRRAGPLAGWQQHLDLLVASGEIATTTCTTYMNGARLFAEWCMAHEVQDITADTVRMWIADLRQEGKAANTINTWLSGLRMLYDWLESTGQIVSNPLRGVRGIRRRGTKRRHLRDTLTDEEVRRLLNAPSSRTVKGRRDQAILTLMLYTAVRTIEVHRANLEDLHTEQGRLVLDVRRKGKADDPDMVVLPSHALDAMLDWLAVRGDQAGPLFISLSNRSAGKRLSLRALRELIKGYMRSAGINSPRKTAHSLRHTAITTAARNGAALLQLQALAGHEDPKTTGIYLHEVNRLDSPPEDLIDYDRNIVE